nr:sodium- and chloride-dependent neutral and basic amino acid transporter B(0+)-like [Nerophis lumbriciformis]
MWKYCFQTPKDAPILDDQDPPGVKGQEVHDRANWTNKTEYVLSMMGYAVGLGNIWRFPYLTYKNGGGAFVIAYLITLLLCGIPLYFLESAIGQFCSQGPVNVWRAVPLLQGVGVGMILFSTLLSIYYNVIVAYGLFYFFSSFQSPLPWSGCFSWADKNCSDKPLVYCNLSGVVMANWTQENISCPSSSKIRVPVQSPSEQYWDHVTLQRSTSIEETGPVLWHLALCLLLSAILVAAALIKGIKSSGKVVYFTTTFPFVALVILLIRGVTLEGARGGIEFYVGGRSNLTKLKEAAVWTDAATQTVFSLSIASGGLVTLASYGHFYNNMFRDTIVICIVNHGTSIIAGFSIFSILGHMSHIYSVPIGDVVKDGFGLAFIAYPEALNKLPVSTLWSVVFFLMIFVVGLDSQFTHIEVISTSLMDAFPKVFKSKRAYVSVGLACLGFLLGLPLVTKAGIYWVTLMDSFGTSWVIIILALMENIGFCFIYGGSRLIEDIEMMIGKKSCWFWLWWKACWFFISPCVLGVILVWSLKTFRPLSYGGAQLPSWAVALGSCIAALPLIPMPVMAAIKLVGAEGNLWKRLKSMCSPSEEWHPFLDVHRGERYSEERCRTKDAPQILLQSNGSLGRAGGKEEEERDGDEPQEVNPVAPPSDPRIESSQRAKNLKNPLQRNKINGPKANETEEWRRLDEHLSGLLQNALRGSVVAKLNLFGEILYEECSNRYGEVTIRETTIKPKSRREKEIDDLVANRRQLRKVWRKAEESEKEGLKALWDEIKRRLTNLPRAERIRRRRKRKEKERSRFFRNPFRHARGLLEEKTSGTLDISKEELEEHIRAQYSDPARNNPIGSPGYVPRPAEPSALFDTSPPKLSKRLLLAGSGMYGYLREVLRTVTPSNW